MSAHTPQVEPEVGRSSDELSVDGAVLTRTNARPVVRDKDPVGAWSHLAAGMAVAAVVAAGGCVPDRTAAPPEAPQLQPGATGASSPAGADPVRRVAIGEIVETGEWGLRVRGVSDVESAGGVTAPDGRVLIVVELELANRASIPRHIGQVDFGLTDTAAGEYPVVATVGEEFMFNTPQPIEAGETRSIKIAYTGVSPVSGELILRFQPFLQTGGMADLVEVRLY